MPNIHTRRSNPSHSPKHPEAPSIQHPYPGTAQKTENLDYIMSEDTFVAVGRRKTATARVRLTRGTGKVQVNGKEADTYFKSEEFVDSALSPLKSVDMTEQVDIMVRAKGGGLNGQAGAVRLGIARALEKMNGELRVDLKKEGHMKRDPRARERKKAGQPGARKNFQFSKR